MTKPRKKPIWPKINSIHFGGAWIGVGILTGAILPFVIWCIFHIFLWPLCAIGGIILLAFCIVFLIEMHQDFGKVPYYKKHLAETIPFDPDTQVAVIKASICTGEQIAGFKNKLDGTFTEVMLIRTDEELAWFKKIYHIDTIKKEY